MGEYCLSEMRLVPDSIIGSLSDLYIIKLFLIHFDICTTQPTYLAKKINDLETSTEHLRIMERSKTVLFSLEVFLHNLKVFSRSFQVVYFLRHIFQQSFKSFKQWGTQRFSIQQDAFHWRKYSPIHFVSQRPRFVFFGILEHFSLEQQIFHQYNAHV